MSHDVEMIEFDEQIIEISDEEDCKAILVIDDDEEIPIDNVKNESSENPVLNWGNTQHLNNAFSNNYISSEGNAAEPVIENVCGIELKQENNIINDCSQNRCQISTSINNSASRVIKKRRKRNKGRRRNKIVGAISKELQSNKPNNSQQNDNYNSLNFVQPTCSSSNINISSTTYDFSKLKWLKPLSNLSSPPHLQMVIIDRSHPDWRIEYDKWLMVEKRLLEALNEEMIRSNDLSIGAFDGAKWQRGIKIVGCRNEKAFDFIIKFLTKLDKLWNEAKLDAFPITHISRHVVKAHIPPPTIKTELIMSLIKLQNPSVYRNDWRVVSERERTNDGGMDIWISVNDQSYKQISVLKGEIKFGINRIFFNPSS